MMPPCWVATPLKVSFGYTLLRWNVVDDYARCHLVRQKSRSEQARGRKCEWDFQTKETSEQSREYEDHETG